MSSRFLLAVALLCCSTALSAQSRSRWSVQASTISLTSSQLDDPIVSGEGQVRMSFGRLSVGLGVARSNFKRLDDIGSGLEVRDVTFTDIFLEPRYVLAVAGPVGFYAAGRIAPSMLEVSSKPFGGSTYTAEGSQNNLSFGGGGGALIRITGRIAGDIGAQYYGISVKNGSKSDRFNFIQGRVGISIGLGN